MARMRRYYVYKINNGGMADLNKLFDSIVAGIVDGRSCDERVVGTIEISSERRED